jgi:shikimate kinase/3-dehydroquinate synthase
MGTGKSTVGRLVAAAAGAPFIDLDEEVGDVAGLFAQGETVFRAAEREALVRVLKDDRVIMARAFVVTLVASVDTILARTAGSDRPLLQVADRRGRITALLGAREAAYRGAHAQIDGERSAGVVAADVLGAWRAGCAPEC